jgi:sulfur-carrier protein adenylyltransferase/sulfurtransferase
VTEFEPAVDERRRLHAARVLLVGVGGLGSPVALHLAAAGVGTMILVDFDRVDESNLQRQVLFDTADCGRAKVEAAADRLRAFNPDLDVQCVDAPFDVANASALVASADVVVDGADNFATRYLVNDACVMARRPNVFGSVARFEGQVAVFAAPGGPCYRCLHPEPPPDGLIPTCAEGGVLGVLPGVIGALQALEVTKLITGVGDPLVGRLLVYDALRMRARDITLPPDASCPICGDAPTITTLAAVAPACATMPEAASTISVEEYLAWRQAGRVHMLVDVREPSEHAVDRIDRSQLVPLGTVAAHLDWFPRDRPVVVHCRTGARSARAVALLRAHGIDARNLQGGIHAWRKA